MLRIAVLSRRWSVRAGNERVAVELARQMQARGHAVTVYCHKDDGSVDPGLLTGSSAVVRVPAIGFDPTLALMSYAWSTQRLVDRLRGEDAVDVVVGFGHSVVHDVYRLGGGTHAEFVELAKEDPDAKGGVILDRVALAMEKVRFRADVSPLLVAPSERVAGELVRHYQVDRARIRVVWNGIDLDRFAPRPDAADPERLATRARWGVDATEQVLLFVGQDPARKGFDVATKVAHALGLTLVYVGRAPRPASLPPRIVWDGERRDVEACYRAADVLLAPSRYDPFGGAVLEALACGCLPVATRRIGATERAYGTPLEALFVEDPGDVDGLITATRRALDRSERPLLVAEAYRVTRDAGRDRWGDHMEAVLEEGARRRRG